MYTVDTRPDVGGYRQELVSPDSLPRALWIQVTITHGSDASVTMYVSRGGSGVGCVRGVGGGWGQ